MMWRVKNIAAAVLGLLVLLVLLKPINLTNADLGRHIKNGELILAGQGGVLNQNYYAYIFSGEPFINHHWLSGVIFYLIFEASGFEGLSVGFSALSVVIFLVFFYLALKESSVWVASQIK